jgi:hypothetical protein
MYICPIASPLVDSSIQSSTNLSLYPLRSFELEAFDNHFGVDPFIIVVYGTPKDQP